MWMNVTLLQLHVHKAENNNFQAQPSFSFTSMKDDLDGRQPQGKTTSREDSLNGRDNLNGRQTQGKITSMEDNLNGIQPQRKTTSIKDDLNGR